MENEFMNELKRLQNEGWALCCGCIHNSDDGCMGCSIETRKRMGLSPEQLKRIEELS